MDVYMSYNSWPAHAKNMCYLWTTNISNQDSYYFKSSESALKNLHLEVFLPNQETHLQLPRIKQLVCTRCFQTPEPAREPRHLCQKALPISFLRTTRLNWSRSHPTGRSAGSPAPMLLPVPARITRRSTALPLNKSINTKCIPTEGAGNTAEGNRDPMPKGSYYL